VALGGSSYAALALPKASVGAKQLKTNSVTSPKVKPGSLLTSDFKASQRASLRGPQGLQGPKGDKGDKGEAGEAGSALAFAHVFENGNLDAIRSKGVTAGNVSHPATGVYCFAGLGYTPRNAVATPQFYSPRTWFRPTSPRTAVARGHTGERRLRWVRRCRSRRDVRHPIHDRLQLTKNKVTGFWEPRSKAGEHRPVRLSETAA
jgi:hypothetical protein